MQPPYDQAKGVIKLSSVIRGGSERTPTTRRSRRINETAESIEVTYDPAQISYDQLLDIFWRQINPTQATGNFTISA